MGLCYRLNCLQLSTIGSPYRLRFVIFISNIPVKQKLKLINKDVSLVTNQLYSRCKRSEHLQICYYIVVIFKHHFNTRSNNTNLWMIASQILIKYLIVVVFCTQPDLTSAYRLNVWTRYWNCPQRIIISHV